MQIASLTRKAEKMPDVAVPAHNRIIGLFACSTTHVVAIAKKPDRRRLGHHDHRAHQQCDRVEVNRPVGICKSHLWGSSR